jgi:hypothetical protein
LPLTGKQAAGKKAKMTVREVTVSLHEHQGRGCDVVRSSRSFRLFLEKAAGFTNFAVKN